MNRGKWRDLFEPQQLEVMDVTLPRSEEWIAHGKEVYERRCLGCHGVNGDGNGPAATFLYNQRPRNFNSGRVQVQADQGTAADRRRSAAHDHAAACAARRCRPGMSCRSTTGSPSSSTSSMCWRSTAPIRRKPYAFFTEEPPGAPLVHRQAAGSVAADPRSRQGGLGAREMLGVPRQDRQGRWREGGRAEGRSRLPDRAGRPHQRPVQVGSGGRGHLPHHDDRVERHAHALLSRLRCPRRTAGRCPTTFSRSPPTRTRSRASRWRSRTRIARRSTISSSKADTPDKAYVPGARARPRTAAALVRGANELPPRRRMSHGRISRSPDPTLAPC